MVLGNYDFTCGGHGWAICGGLFPLIIADSAFCRCMAVALDSARPLSSTWIPNRDQTILKEGFETNLLDPIVADRLGPLPFN
jgi:hypothetical protein